MKVGYQTNTWGGVVGHPAGVTSVKDLFYLANGSTEQAVRDIALAGYDGIELFDGNLHAYEERPDEFRGLLEKSGLELVAVYSGANFIYADILDDEFWRIEKAAALAARFGAQHFVVGGGAPRFDGIRDDDYARLAEGLDRVVAVAEAEGLQPSFHPHLGTIVETPEQIEMVFSRTRIGFCPDIAHLAAGGGDPAALIHRYAHRIPYAHLKDLSLEPFGFLPLGKGIIDVPAVLDALQATSLGDWITVELDSYEGEPIEGAMISKAYLASLGLT